MESTFQEMGTRAATITRETTETQVQLSLNLDSGSVKIDTGVGFFDHMLTAFATHGGFGLEVKTVGDWNVDCHHTVEDTGIVLGKAFAKALGDKSGIKRFGSAFIPMDEALGFASVDISNRAFLAFNATFPQEKVGEFDTCMAEEFFRAFAFNAGLTLHVKCEYGTNSHHMIEALFKATAYALKEATTQIDSFEAVSTKGML